MAKKGKGWLECQLGTEGIGVQNEFNHVFLAGDLNYRIDTVEDSRELEKEDPAWYKSISLSSSEEVLRLIREKKWEELWEEDQLRKAMGRVPSRGSSRAARILPFFEEAGDPAFPPTFKCIPAHKAGEKDPAVDYDMKRVPSWCDRILYSRVFSEHGVGAVKTLRYESCPGVLTSDHKPVFA
eukprot:gene3721-5092_t